MINNKSFEDIRKNWSEYKDKISKEQYELVWNDLIDKFNLDKSNYYLSTFIKFIGCEKIHLEKHETKIIQEDENTLILKGLDGQERKELHKLCDHIGLHHQSIVKKKNKKHLYVYKPANWLWEFTERNPYSESDEVYVLREIESKIRHDKEIEKLGNLYCCECYANGSDKDLYRSVYIRGLYCDDCLETTSDGGGGLLSDHKFELL